VCGNIVHKLFQHF